MSYICEWSEGGVPAGIRSNLRNIAIVLAVLIALAGVIAFVWHADEPRSWKCWPEYACLPVLMISAHLMAAALPNDSWLAAWSVVWFSSGIFLGVVLWTKLLMLVMEAVYRRGRLQALRVQHGAA